MTLEGRIKANNKQEINDEKRNLRIEASTRAPRSQVQKKGAQIKASPSTNFREIIHHPSISQKGPYPKQ